MLIGIKNKELNVERQKWKARLVVDGGNVTTTTGTRATEEDLFGSPASLEAVCLVVFVGLMLLGNIILCGDVTAAYLQARLGGAPTWLLLPSQLWPASWFDGNGSPRWKRPVVRLHRAIYGLKRSGFDWAAKAQRVLLEHGWRPVLDEQENFFWKVVIGELLILCLYVDDLLAAGPEAVLRPELEAMRCPEYASPAGDSDLPYFCMSKAEVAQHFLGMDVSPIFLVNGCPTFDISQPVYTCMLIEQYRELFEFNGAFRSFKTPAEDHDVSFLGTGPDADTVGAHAAGAPRMV